MDGLSSYTQGAELEPFYSRASEDRERLDGQTGGDPEEMTAQNRYKKINVLNSPENYTDGNLYCKLKSIPDCLFLCPGLTLLLPPCQLQFSIVLQAPMWPQARTSVIIAQIVSKPEVPSNIVLLVMCQQQLRVRSQPCHSLMCSS